MKQHDIWTDEAIRKTVKIIGKAKKNKHRLIKLLDSLVFWILLPLVVIGNAFVSVFLIPVLLALSGIFIYLIIAILGFSFGFLFQLVMHDIEKLDKKHHMIYGVLVLVVTTINYIVIVTLVNYNLEIFHLPNKEHNGFLLGLNYAIFFLIPYVYYFFIRSKVYK